MKAKDLRLGNTIQSRRNSNEWYDLELDLPNIELIDEYPEAYRSISITEEWLFKFGFNKEKEYHIYGNYMIFIIDGLIIHTPRPDQNTADYNTCPDFYIKNCFNVAVEIKYVHQLQNLYFALTGEELTIKPNE